MHRSVLVSHMRIVSFIHPTRTYLPCSGIGRHMNHMLLGLASRHDTSLSLLCSQEWVGPDGKLDPRTPLRDLPAATFPMAENRTERQWKLLGRPAMDAFVPDGTDWLYAPMETYLPVKKCPVAVTLHDIQAFETSLPWSKSWSHRWFRLKWESWVQKALQECRVVFTVSEFSKSRIVELLGADAKRVIVIGNGVDPAFFAVADSDPAAVARPVDSPYVLVIGGLRRKKGAGHVLAIARALHQMKTELQIVVAGPSEPDYAAQARTYANVHLLGTVPDDDLPILLRGASALLFLSPYEGFGIPAAEAMATGVPAVVANRASLPEVVGDAGLIVEPDAADEIADLLINLANDPALCEQYVQRGLRRAQQFRWDYCVSRVLAAFRQYG